MKNTSLLMEVINDLKDKRPGIKEILCEAILIELEDKMEIAYEEGIKEGRKRILNEIVEGSKRSGSAA